MSRHAPGIGNDGARTGLFPGTGKAFPKFALPLRAPEQNRLHRTGMSGARTEDARGNDLGVVEDEAVARMQQVGNVAEQRVPDLSGRAVDRHQPAHIPSLGRRLCNEPLRQLVGVRGAPQQIDA